MLYKTLFLLIFVLKATTITYAQDLYLTQDEKKLGDTVYVRGLPTDSLIAFDAVLHNNSDYGMNVKVVREELAVLENTMNTFNWAGFPNSPDMDTSMYYDFIPAGGTNDTSVKPFIGEYYPKGVIGTSTIKYTFYNIDNTDQRVEVVVRYWASPQNIAEEAMNGGSISDIYPNPANSFINFDYLLTLKVNTAKVRIYNLLGATIKETVLERGTHNLKLDVFDLDNGIYFYSIVINGVIYQTKKFVIQR